jgi:sugar/nucleoside kinase (ribokinase family)
MGEAPAVVVVGAACRDLVDDDPRGWRLGGGASYTALALARLGFSVGALVVADPPAARSTELDAVRDAGVEVLVIPDTKGPIFINTETPTGRIQRSPQVSDPVDPGHLPARWRTARAWMFAPVAAEVPEAWAAVPPGEATVALGWQGLLRVMQPGAVVHHLAPGPSAVVRRADLIGVGRDDIDPSTEPAELTRLMHPGATMLLTDGVRGGRAIEVGSDGAPLRSRVWSALPVERYVDPVGAGDTFLAGVLAARLEPSITASWPGADADLRMGAACGSLVLEGPGLFGVPDLAAARHRMLGEPAHPGDGDGAAVGPAR